jgi:hypothetical protein
VYGQSATCPHIFHLSHVGTSAANPYVTHPVPTCHQHVSAGPDTRKRFHMPIDCRWRPTPRVWDGSFCPHCFRNASVAHTTPIKRVLAFPQYPYQTSGLLDRCDAWLPPPSLDDNAKGARPLRSALVGHGRATRARCDYSGMVGCWLRCWFGATDLGMQGAHRIPPRVRSWSGKAASSHATHTPSSANNCRCTLSHDLRTTCTLRRFQQHALEVVPTRASGELGVRLAV